MSALGHESPHCLRISHPHLASEDSHLNTDTSGDTSGYTSHHSCPKRVACLQTSSSTGPLSSLIPLYFSALISSSSPLISSALLLVTCHCAPMPSLAHMHAMKTTWPHAILVCLGLTMAPTPGAKLSLKDIQFTTHMSKKVTTHVSKKVNSCAMRTDEEDNGSNNHAAMLGSFQRRT